MRSVYRMNIKLAVIVASVSLLILTSFFSQAKERGRHHEHRPPHHNNHSNHHRHHHDRWRWGLGISSGFAFGMGFPYWNSYRPYWDSSVYVPYRYNASQPVVRQPKVVQAPQQVTTHVEVSHGINSLPANAKVKQKNGRTVYEWQGTEYIYDWQTQSYKAISPFIE